MKNLYRLLALSATLLLTGCQTTPPVTQIEYIYKARPQALSQKYHKVAPPRAAAYMASSWEDKEAMWIDIYRAQNKAIDLCNLQTDKGSEWDALQKANYTKHKEAP